MACFVNEVYRRKYSDIMLRWILSDSEWVISPSAQGFAELLDTKFEVAEMEH